MYATCLFCNGALGRNEAIEHFTVGRRLAFDSTKGRLWVVCPQCARWNLTPLETRWEAIEEAERMFRDTRLRASTDNVGLAKLREGTELVRIGKPMLPEFAAWRYGRMLISRRRKQFAFGAVLTTLSAGAVVVAFPSSATALGVDLRIAMWAPLAAQYGISIARGLRERRRRVRVRLADVLFSVSYWHAHASRLEHDRANGGWRLHLAHGSPSVGLRHLFELLGGGPTQNDLAPTWTVLDGPDALRGLSNIVPSINRYGGAARTVDDAVRILASGKDTLEIVDEARLDVGWAKQSEKPRHLGALPPSVRLALEMSLHEHDERRALDGELAELETRWREAEEIAQIADDMFVTPSIDERVRELKDQ